VTSAGGTTYDITVTYSGAAAIDPATISTGDLRVTGPNGFNALPVIVTAVASGGALTATYRLTPSGGTWDAADGGAYLVTIEPGPVGDRRKRCGSVVRRPRRRPRHFRDVLRSDAAEWASGQRASGKWHRRSGGRCHQRGAGRRDPHELRPDRQRHDHLRRRNT